MSVSHAVAAFTCTAFLLGYVSCQARFNPTILQDSRLEPKVDGTFGFQYKTENGIQHAARGDPSGQVQGSYSYTDPTGLKVNFNYNAGSRTAAGTQQSDPESDNGQYNNPAPAQAPAQIPTSLYSSRYRQEEQYREPEPQYQYRQPAPQYTQPPQQDYPAITRQQYSSDAGEVYQQRRTRPHVARVNEVSDEQYRG